MTTLQETRRYYWVEIGEEKSADHVMLRVSKRDHTVKRIDRFVMDNLYLSCKSIYFNNGYITLTYHPCTLMEELNKIIKNKKVEERVRKNAERLCNSLNEDDNDVVFVGKLK